MEKKKLIETINNLISNNSFLKASNLIDSFLIKYPNDLDLQMMKGLSLFNLNQHNDSVKLFSKIISFDPKISYSYYVLAKNYIKLEKNNLANINFIKAIELEPNNKQYLLDYAIFLYDMEQYLLSIKQFNILIGLSPNDYQAYFYLGLNYIKSFQDEEALVNLKKADNLFSNNSEIHNAIGTVYERKNNYELAKQYFQSSFDLNHQNLLPLLNLATIEQTFGNFDKSKIYLNKIIQINPEYGEAYRLLSIITKFTKSDNLISKMENIYNKLDSSINKMHLGFALSKAYEDIENYKIASKYLVQSNDYKRNQFKGYSLNSEIKIFNFFKKSFDYSFYNKFYSGGYESNIPIFIVGMPRSGTTLVEQILSSHKNVKAGGELNEFYLMLEKNIKFIKKNDTDLLDQIQNISDQSIYQIGKNYCQRIQSIISTNHRITDKQPLNFQYIGLILACLPKSKIIHCYRNPKDNCLSLYKNYFIQNVMPWSYNQYELNCYYFLYKDLINFYISEFKDKIFNLNYETLVSSPEKTIKNVLNYCDLSWDDNCLKFYESKNLIKTASIAQVRNKLYTSSIKKYENYEKYLPELFSKLDEI